MLGLSRLTQSSAFSIQTFLTRTQLINTSRHAQSFPYEEYLFSPLEKPLPLFDRHCCLETLRVISLGHHATRFFHKKNLFHTLTHFSDEFSIDDMIVMSTQLANMGLYWHHLPKKLQSNFILRLDDQALHLEPFSQLCRLLPRFVKKTNPTPSRFFDALFKQVQHHRDALPSKTTVELIEGLSATNCSYLPHSKKPSLSRDFQDCLFSLLNQHFHTLNIYNKQKIINHLKCLRAWSQLSNTSWREQLCESFKNTGCLVSFQALSYLDNGWRSLCQSQAEDAIVHALKSADYNNFLSYLIALKYMNLRWDKELLNIQSVCLQKLHRLSFKNLDIHTLVTTLNGLNVKYSNLPKVFQRQLSQYILSKHSHFRHNLSLFLCLAKMKVNDEDLMHELITRIEGSPPTDSASIQIFLTGVFHLKHLMPDLLNYHYNFIQSVREQTNLETQVSPSQGAFTQKMAELLPQYQIKSEAMIDGCLSVDILVKKSDSTPLIIIEIDGQQHYQHGRLRTKDIQRDDALKRDKYYVFRVLERDIRTPESLEKQAILMIEKIQIILEPSRIQPSFSPQFKQAKTTSKDNPSEKCLPLKKSCSGLMH